MLVLRWVFLGLYLSLLGGLVLLGWWKDEDVLPLIVISGVMVVGQALFVFGAGTTSLCRPVRSRRLVLPVAVAALLGTVLVAGFVLAMMELFRLETIFERGGFTGETLFCIFLLACWTGWGVLLMAYARRWSRYQLLSRVATGAFAGSLAELIAAVPAHVIVTRRPGCFVGILTALGIIAGIWVMVFSFGPMIIVLFLRPRLRRERESLGQAFCAGCGGALNPADRQCSACGQLVVGAAFPVVNLAKKP